MHLVVLDMLQFGSQWFKGEWNNNCQYQNIAVLELYPIVLAVEVWSKYMANRCILFNTDNQALVHVINKQTSKDSHIMFLVRKVVLRCLKFNFF